MKTRFIVVNQKEERERVVYRDRPVPTYTPPPSRPSKAGDVPDWAVVLGYILGIAVGLVLTGLLLAALFASIGGVAYLIAIICGPASFFVFVVLFVLFSSMDGKQ